MFECPDVFMLGGRTVVLTSVEGDTQWMVGTVQPGASPSFVPSTGGYSDQGVDYYAAKTGAPARPEHNPRQHQHQHQHQNQHQHCRGLHWLRSINARRARDGARPALCGAHS